MKALPNICRVLSLSALALFALPALAQSAPEAPAASAQAFESQGQLESWAKGAAAQEFPPLTSRQRFLVGPIEAHAQLATCRSAVRALPTTTHHMADRVTIELRCQDAPGWHLYVPVRIVGISTAAVAAHAIVMGTVLKEGDLKIEERDVSELPLGFLDDPAIAVGLTAARPIAQGTYITNQQLVASKAVQRGQLVTLVADAGGMSIRMSGRALTDGLLNQRVKVTNLSSGKVVEGVARSEQTVEIILQ
jgi:flagella basal body P-ring formation protein FlgA